MGTYLVLIYDDEKRFADTPREVMADMHARHVAFIANNKGAIVGGAQLATSDTTTTIRQAEGGVTVTDGTFLETKEVLGGYYVIEAPDYDQALALAKQVPSVYGAIELWPQRVPSDDLRIEA
ncbi:YciI family protein [Gryllotalpicola reticulitermitis]|uniref:YciI family protein n=1 Tax=Gryllotalpicola reticulitermitis TaxID=1184153 RepID=A0ABV8QAS2_9MICO